MGHVGDVDADLPYPVAELAYREGVVEVLGVGRVDGEGRRCAEIPPLGVIPGRNRSRNGCGRGFHLLVEAIGEVEFGQDGVHLGVVFTRHAQHVEQLARGTFRALGPLRDADDDLLAAREPGVAFARKVDVHRHLARIDFHEDFVRRDLCDPDVAAVAAGDDAQDLAVELALAGGAGDDEFDPVAVERIGRVALIDIDVAVEFVRADVHRARGDHLHHPDMAGKLAAAETVFVPFAHLRDPLGRQPVEDFTGLCAAVGARSARGGGQVAEGEFMVRGFAQQMQDERCAVGGNGCFLSVSCHVFVNRRRASSCMNPMPHAMAPSSGLKVDVWSFPAAAPTPNR